MVGGVRPDEEESLPPSENKRNWQLVNFCENDKYAIKSYCAIHHVDESLNLGDITKVDETKIEDFNMMTWGFPCTQISCSGKQEGFFDKNGNKTASGLYYDGIRILRYKKPAISLIENVKNLTSKKFKNEFNQILTDLEEAGYNSYWKVLNSKDYGIPQNRERVFIISIRKDLDNGKFKFPEGFDNGLRLKDFLEDKVGEKFYISDEKVKRFIENLEMKEIPNPSIIDPQGRKRNANCKPKDCVPTIRANTHGNLPQVIQVGNIAESKGWSNSQVGRIYSAEGVSPTLNTCGGGQREPKIVIDSQETENNIRIRKLTPKEFFRLQGFGDENYEAASKVCSNSQLRRQIGNSITVDVLYYIFVELYKAMPYLFDDLKLGSFFSGIGAPEKALDRLYESINSGKEL